jgi:NhaP-type Na+/H+ or K+/H+ antiporter
MTLDVLLSVVGLLGMVVAALSARIRRLPVSEPLLALLAGVLVGPQLLGWLPLSPITSDHETLHEASRILLSVSVMAVALRYPFRAVSARAGAVTLLLLVAMPVMAIVTTLLGMGLLGLSLSAALLLGTALTPTDPVLASSVVTGGPAEKDLPARDRQLLSLESGANDGLALPLVLVAVAVAGPLGAQTTAGQILWKVLGAVVLGVVAGWLAGASFRAGEKRGAASGGPVLFFTVVLALGVLGASGMLRLDGVLAAFVAGLTFNMVSGSDDRGREVSIDEAVNRFAVLPLFLAFGASLPWAHWRGLGWGGVALVVAVLVFRRLPVLLLLKRPLRLGWADAAYLGWFGPIGVSALFYLTLEAKDLGLSGDVVAAGALVVAASTLVHGLTTSPGLVLYRRATAAASDDARAPEKVAVG